MCRIKISLQDFVLKRQGGLCAKGGGHICRTLWYTNTQAIRANGTILTHGYVLYVAAITH